MADEYLTTRELATLLRVRERKVYDLVASGKIPYSKTTGKLLFPRAAIDRWLHENSVGVPGPSARELPNVFLGSHDPLLDWALRESRCDIATFFDSSYDGLERFCDYEGIATGLHIFDAGEDSWNSHAIREKVSGRDVVLLRWASRSRGLVVCEPLAKQVHGLGDVAGLRFAARQSSAGASSLFAAVLERAGVDLNSLVTGVSGRSEADVALQVVEGKADFAFGLQSVAAQYRLPFVPVIEERFDLLVDRRAYFESGLQTLFRFCSSDPFLERASELPGYDVSELGTVVLNP